MTLFRKLLPALIGLILPMIGQSAVMKVGDIVAITSLQASNIATNRFIVSDVNHFLTNATIGPADIVSVATLVWTNDNGTLKPVAFPTNILLRVNVPDDGIGTNFYFDAQTYRTNAHSKLFTIRNGGSNALTVGPNGGLFMGRGNTGPFPGGVLYGLYDTALGETNQQEIFTLSGNSAVGYSGASDLIIDTNYGALILFANKEGGVKFTRFSVQAGAGDNPQDFNSFTMQALVDGATYMQMDPNFSLLTPTNYLFSSSIRITNTHTLFSLQNSNFPVLEVDGVGDLRLIKKIPYLWPSSQGAAGTALTNNGSGALGWWPITTSGGTLTFSDLLWTNEPSGRIHPVTFTNRLEVQRSITIGTNSQNYAGPPGTNDLLFAYRDITKAEDWAPRFEVGAFSNTVISTIQLIADHWNSDITLNASDEGGNTASLQIFAATTGGGPGILMFQTNGFVPFAVGGQQTIINNITYTFPLSQGAAQTILTNDGAGNLGWGTDHTSAGGTVAFSDLVWTNKLGTLYPVAYPTNIILNPTNDGSTGLEVYTTNFLFQTDHYRSGGTNTLFAVFNGGRSAMVVGDQGMMLGSTNYILVPQMSIDAAYDVAFGDFQDKLISLQMFNGAPGAGNLCTSELQVGTNYGGLNLTANNVGTGNTLFSMRVGNDSANWEKFVASLLVQNSGGTLITPFLIDPGFHTSPTGYVFGTTYRTTNTQMIMSLQNSNFPVFEVDGVGDLRKIKKIAYTWPSSQGSAQTVLTNDGSGNLGWGTGPVLTTNANQFLGRPLAIKDGALLTNVVVYPTGNGTAPALTVTNVPGMGTNSFQVLNTNGVPVIFALTNDGITLVASNVNFLGPQTNTSSLNVLGGVTNWAAVQTRGNATNAGWLAIAGGFTNIGGSLLTGSVTNGGRVDTAGGHTNWIGAENKGTLYASSNLLVKAGQSTSNAWVGGLIYWSTTSFTNLNATATMSNLANVSVPAHVLTNNGDTIHAIWGGIMPNALANTNQFQIVFGSQTILDTGLQIASNTVFRAETWITRTGNTAQHAEGRFEWGPGGAVPFAFTNVNLELVQTNGIATTLALKGGARRVGAHTNNSFRVYYDPAAN